MLAGCCSFRPLAAKPAPERPNIIFILIDDQRYDFLSFLDQAPDLYPLLEEGLERELEATGGRRTPVWRK